MTTPTDYYYIGYKDGYTNRPKAKGLKNTNKAAYENGYRAGSIDRSRDGQQAKST